MVCVPSESLFKNLKNDYPLINWPGLFEGDEHDAYALFDSQTVQDWFLGEDVARLHLLAEIIMLITSLKRNINLQFASCFSNLLYELNISGIKERDLTCIVEILRQMNRHIG